MKKGVIGLVVLGLFLSVFMTGFVSAGIAENIEKGIDDVIVKPLNPILKFIVGDSPDGEFLLVKFLALILIFSLAYAATKKIPGIQENRFVSVIISIIIGILGTRFLTSEELVEFLWLPTGVFGVVVVALFPFILFFFMVESFDSRVIRKVSWITFAVGYLALAIYRWDALEVGNQWWNNLGWWYIIIGVLSILAVYFDKQLRARFVLGSLGKETSKRNLVSAANFMEEIDDQMKVRDRAIREGETRVQAAAEREIKRLQKAVATLK